MSTFCNIDDNICLLCGQKIQGEYCDHKCGFYCEECDVIFDSTEEMRNHQCLKECIYCKRMIHPSNIKTHICTVFCFNCKSCYDRNGESHNCEKCSKCERYINSNDKNKHECFFFCLKCRSMYKEENHECIAKICLQCGENYYNYHNCKIKKCPYCDHRGLIYDMVKHVKLEHPPQCSKCREYHGPGGGQFHVCSEVCTKCHQKYFIKDGHVCRKTLSRYLPIKI